MSRLLLLKFNFIIYMHDTILKSANKENVVESHLCGML